MVLSSRAFFQSPRKHVISQKLYFLSDVKVIYTVFIWFKTFFTSCWTFAHKDVLISRCFSRKILCVRKAESHLTWLSVSVGVWESPSTVKLFVQFLPDDPCNETSCAALIATFQNLDAMQSADPGNLRIEVEKGILADGTRWRVFLVFVLCCVSRRRFRRCFSSFLSCLFVLFLFRHCKTGYLSANKNVFFFHHIFKTWGLFFSDLDPDTYI